MLSSITPLGERGRRNRFVVTATAFAVGSALGGALMGAGLGAFGAAINPGARLAVGALGALAILGALFDAGTFGRRVPTIRRQVDETWLGRYRGTVYGFAFGVQLGVGLATIVTTSAVYVMAAAVLLSGSVGHGLVIGVVFGTVRGLSVFSTRSLMSPDAMRAFHRRLASGRAAVNGGGAAAQGIVGAAAAFAMVVGR
jgi:hypothetical protein